MELNHKKLQTLIQEIENSIIFCRHCSKQIPFEERKGLIAIRNSVKDVDNTLLHFQKLQARQLTERHSVLSRLEQSRIFLIKQVTQYEGRPLDVAKELSACFNNMEETVKKNEGQSTRRGLSGFLFCWFTVLFKPWKWKNIVGITVKLILISSTIRFYHSKENSFSNSQRRLLVSAMYSKEKAETLDSLLTISKMPLDVFCGRG
ncbi:uncharacterized protein LOC120165229 [Hibiscus syriacus]|uniref:uncharacterized protein LOC120165229 n=1 Tax=Hibiscus syriacus TaxID=106335 RepID=UPI001923E7BC|nr:uncharacterized protein LOC120165229 [Hibiscus syriacus]